MSQPTYIAQNKVSINLTYITENEKNIAMHFTIDAAAAYQL
jgi:N-acetylmuramoyl-L-alanine amidase CwlA